MSVARQADELTLRMVRLRAAGKTPTAIAAQLGLEVQFVSTATNRVLRADAADRGEDVAGAYWQVKRRGASA